MTNSNTASAALPENFTLIDLAKSGGWKAFASTGIACPLAWGFIINAIGATEPTGQIPWTVSYLVLAVAVIAFAAISRSIPAFFTSQSMELIAAVLGAASTVFMVLSFTVFDSVSIQYLTTILCACVLGWLYLQWGTFYAQLGLRSTVCYLFLANIGGSTIKAFSHFIPIWGQCLLGMALPVLSVVM